MVRRLNSSDPGFSGRFEGLLALKRESASETARDVAEIIARVRAEGDSALVALTRRFDRSDIAKEQLRVTVEERDRLAAVVEAPLAEALEQAAARIRAYHEHQLPEDRQWQDEAGVTLGWRWTPVDAVGLYVPGGMAAYPSSVLMNAIPALVAGAARLAMVVPAPDGVLNPLVMAAARLCGIEEIYRIGGAQAVAALAYGTESVEPVDKIVGPGNAWVAAAKRQVFGEVGIDSIAGPSEILVVADADNDPEWIAADLLSQAEHDTAAQAILMTADAAFANAVEAAVERLLAGNAREDIARAAWTENSAILVLQSLEEAPALVNRLAPEHLELAVADPAGLLPLIRHAGAVFLGRYTPEAIGDYVAGPDHVLPTSRAARYASGLSVLDFLKRTSIIGCTKDSIARIGPAAVTLAEAEGLGFHGLSVALRLRN